MIGISRSGRSSALSDVARRFFSGSRVIPASFLGIHAHRWPAGNFFTFTVNTGTDRLVVAHSNRGNYNWMNLYFTTTGTLPAPLEVGVKYWNLFVDSGNVQVSLTQDGPPIDITSAGSGTHTMEFRAPAPTYGYGHYRSWDGVRWGQVHTADDTYDATTLDNKLVPQIDAGRKIMWCAASTPTWASSSSGSPGVYANGDAHPPINISSATGPLKEFITWLVTRYNKASGGLYGTDATRIQWIEVWNEPAFAGEGFWKGTASELAQIALAIKEAAHAVDATVQIIAPGWGGGATLGTLSAASAIDQFMAASDGAAGTGKDHVTGFCWHPYGRGFPSGGSDVEMIAQDSWARSALAKYGLTTLHANEWGDFPSASGQVTFTRQTRADVMRTIAMQAFLGWNTTTIYSHDNQLAFVAPVGDAEMSALLDQFHTAVAGKTLTEAVVLTDGRVRGTFSDQSRYFSPAV